MSNQHYLENGVPQGSTLSVVLFAIAVNTLTDNLNPVIGRSLYVDDLAIFYSASSMEIIEETLQEAIDGLVDHAGRLGFRFSPSKTYCVHFCRRRLEHDDPTLKLQDRTIEVKETVRFLGLIFDKKTLLGLPHRRPCY